MYVEANGKIYTFYDHAVTRMKERNIRFEWVEVAMREPDDTIQLAPGRIGHDKEIENHSIRVVVDEETSQIVTIYRLDENDE